MIDGFGKLAVKQSGCRYEVGDLVWGKVRSHPWWPGQIFHEAFALPCVSKTKREGHVLVAFFGDNSYGWFDPFELVPFEINYVEKSKQTNDWEFVNAIRDATDEARRQAALGLSCQCQSTCSFQATGVNGLFEVDVCGFQPGGLYSVKQIKNAREWFRPFEVLCFLKKLASMAYGNSDRSINWIKNEAVVLAYRKLVFEEVDETYVEANASKLIHCEIPNETLNQGHMLFKDGTVRTFGNMSTTHGRCPSGKETTTLKKKSICKEISLIKPLVFRETWKVKNGEISQDFQELQSKVSKARKTSCSLENVRMVGRPSDAVLLRKVCITSSDSLEEKPRVLKCFGEDLLSEKTPTINKKRRKECKSELGLGHKHNCLKKAKSESGDGALSTCSSDLNLMAAKKTISFRRVNNSKLPHLLGYLSDLALDPLHSGQPNISATMLPFFLEFRSFIYKKVVVAPVTEAESTENSPTDSPACSVAAMSHYSGTAQDLPSALKPPKKRLKSDDYGNVGLNGSIFGIGKQMYVEEPKRLNELKALIEERKPDDEIMNFTFQTKLTKYSHKNHDASTRVTKPKMIVIQFPSQSALPSVSELKAKFARFGQLGSPPRVIWKSSTCQVLFKSNSDAKAAYNYAVKKRLLFGSVKVEYYLQALEPLATEFPIPGRQLTGRAPDIVPCVKSTCTSNQSTKPRPTMPHHQLMHPSVQQKSCLEKQLIDEGTVQSEKRNLQKVMPPLLPPLPLLNRISHEHENRKVNHSEVLKMQVHQPEAARNNLVHTSSSSQSTDISGEMLNLLMRCHDIVAGLKCSLGYVPLRL